MYVNMLNEYLRKEFGTKVLKLALSSGCSCPNRDGTIGIGGCLFCGEDGSGEFSETILADSVDGAIERARERVRRKAQGGAAYIAYFQSYTNTYGPVERLGPIFFAAIRNPDIVALSIATRPDCLSDEMLDLLSELNRIKPVWVELGLQTVREETAEAIRRGYRYPVFADTYRRLVLRGIRVIVHLILGLPGESRDDMLESVTRVADLRPFGVKLHVLYVLQGTDLAALYERGEYQPMSSDDYFAVLGEAIERLPCETVLHRLTGDGPKSLLLAPLWTADKRRARNEFQRYLRENDITQGRLFVPAEGLS